MKINLFFKVISITSLLILATSILLSAFFIHYEAERIRENLDAKGRTLVRNLASGSEFGVVFEDRELLESLVEGILGEDDVVYVRVADTTGAFFVERRSDEVELPATAAPDENLVTPQVTTELFDVPDSEEQIYDFTVPVLTESYSGDETELSFLDADTPAERKQVGTARVGISLKNLRGSLARVQRTVILITAAVFVGGVLLSGLFAAFVTRPIRDLVAGTQRVSKGGFDTEIEIRSRDEIGDLAVAFNRMTSDLERTTVSKDYVANVISTMTDCLTVLSPDRCIKTVNNALCSLLGYDEAELIGRPFDKILAEPVWVEVLFAEGAAFEETIRNIETHYTARDGQGIPMLVSGAAMRDESGAVTGIVCVAQDITERVQAEQALVEAKEAAETANRAKSEFLANMSHELRTPLNAILGYAQVLQKAPGLTDMQQRGLGTIRHSGDHLLGLINEILDLSKVEAGRMEVDRRDFSLSKLLDHLSYLFAVRAAEKKLHFLYEELTDLPTRVHGDERKLRQVLMNLLGNAVKFTDTGGLTLKVGLVDGRIRFQVEDTGYGIPAESMQEIFESFQRVGEKSRNQEGTGLGLPISQRLTRLMGGELRVASEVDVGSRFWFDLELPEAAPPAVALEPARQITGYVGERRRILIVDDKPVNREVLRCMLEPLGFDTLEAADGERGVQCVIEREPDLVLMDLRMPGMGGLAAIRQLRALPGGDRVKIITVSASAFQVDRRESRLVGSDDFLPKPFREEVLIALLQQHLSLEWTYAEPAERAGEPQRSDTPASDALMSAPPFKDLEALADLARRGNLDAIAVYADQLERVDAALRAFCAELRALAREFKVRELQRFVARFWQDEPALSGEKGADP